MHTIIRDNYDPTPNEYHETIVVDEAREKRWLFDCDGVYHDITNVKVVSERGESEDYAASQKWVTKEVEALEAADQALQDNIDAEATTREAADKTLQDNIDAEEAGRTAADIEIWDEIEALEAASDVVDIVGTKAELDDYDTSKLSDKDIIKVLADETHDDAIAYYRWDTATKAFTFIGVEGPYYTASETDTLLAGKVDKTSVTSTPSFVPMSASETLVMSQKGVARQVLNPDNGGIQISSTGGNASAGSAVSVAIGPYAEAGPSPATAVGYNSKALGSCSTALGYTAKAAGSYDIAIGGVSTKVAAGATQTNNNLAVGSTLGTNIPKATGGNSTAIGHGAIAASGANSTAIGYGTIEASGGTSMAIGMNTVTAAGNNDIAIGANGTTTKVSSGTQTTGNVSVGLGVTANGGNSAAFGGYGVSATGQNSTAIGQSGVTSSGKGSTALGYSVTAAGENSVAIGASEVTSYGQYSVAIGASGARAYDSYNMALGIGGADAGDGRTAVSTSYNFAFGGQSVAAVGGNSVAIGTMGTRAEAVRSVALGHRGCVASHADSVALGTDSLTGRTSEVSLGRNASGSNPEVTKYIAHVTAGVNNTDAVNVAQLNAAIPGVMTGATSSAAGTSGLVPAPAAGDNTKVLRGDGTWGAVTANALLIKEWS